MAAVLGAVLFSTKAVLVKLAFAYNCHSFLNQNVRRIPLSTISVSFGTSGEVFSASTEIPRPVDRPNHGNVSVRYDRPALRCTILLAQRSMRMDHQHAREPLTFILELYAESNRQKRRRLESFNCAASSLKEAAVQAQSIMRNVRFGGDAATLCLIKDARGKVLLEIRAALDEA